MEKSEEAEVNSVEREEEAEVDSMEDLEWCSDLEAMQEVYPVWVLEEWEVLQVKVLHCEPQSIQCYKS